MSTATNDQPADTGVDGEGQAHDTDDIDTEAFDRMEAQDENDDEAEGDAGDGDEDGEDGVPKLGKTAAADAETEEVEHEGQKYRVPKAIRPLIMMQADYTQKTQGLADARRQHEQEVEAWQSERTQQAESLKALAAEHRKVATIEAGIEQATAALDQPVDRAGLKLRDINWSAFRAQAQGSEEAMEMYHTLRGRYDAARETLSDLKGNLEAAKGELQTKEAQRLKDAETAAQADLSKRQQETGRVLAAEIPGWNKQLATEAIEFGIRELGLQPDEVPEMTDPRVWKMLHELKTAKAEIAKLTSNRKQQQTAQQNSKAQASQPAARPKGGAGANSRDPATPRGDGLSTDEWMRRRQAQLAKAK